MNISVTRNGQTINFTTEDSDGDIVQTSAFHGQAGNPRPVNDYLIDGTHVIASNKHLARQAIAERDRIERDIADTPACGNQCGSNFECRAKNSGYQCSRISGHADSLHVACGTDRHALHTWTEDPHSTTNPGENAFTDEEEARTMRRHLINQGRSVSLLAYDPSRNLHVFDVLN